MHYQIGQEVEVLLPDGWLPGKVTELKHNYGFHGGELKYEVHGAGKVKYVTITSERCIRPLNT